MYLNQKNKNPRSVQLLGDIAHILICICIVALAVLAFLDPAGNSMVYPVIFFLAAVLNGMEAAGKLRRGSKKKNQKAAGLVFALAAFALLILTAVSAVSVWRA